MLEKTLKLKAYEIIKNKIITCELMPGEFLDEKQLIEEIGASRTPIREALNKIEQENLITIIPKKGIMVANLTMKDILDVFGVRERMEPFFIIEFGHTLNKNRLKKFEKDFGSLMNEVYANKEELLKRSIELDDDLHNYIITNCNNKYFINMMNDVNTQNQRIRILSGKVENRIDRSTSEHLEIIHHLILKDYKNAANSIQQHLIYSKEIIIENYYNGAGDY